MQLDQNTVNDTPESCNARFSNILPRLLLSCFVAKEDRAGERGVIRCCLTTSTEVDTYSCTLVLYSCPGGQVELLWNVDRYF